MRTVETGRDNILAQPLTRRKVLGALATVATASIAGGLLKDPLLDLLTKSTSSETFAILQPEQIKGKSIRTYENIPYRWVDGEPQYDISDSSLNDKSTAELLIVKNQLGKDAGVVVLKLDPGVLTSYPGNGGLTVSYAIFAEDTYKHTLTPMNLTDLLVAQNRGKPVEEHSLTLILANPNTFPKDQQDASNVLTIEATPIDLENGIFARFGSPNISCTLTAEKISFDPEKGYGTSSNNPQYCIDFNPLLPRNRIR